MKKLSKNDLLDLRIKAGDGEEPVTLSREVFESLMDAAERIDFMDEEIDAANASIVMMEDEISYLNSQISRLEQELEDA